MAKADDLRVVLDFTFAATSAMLKALKPYPAAQRAARKALANVKPKEYPCPQRK